MQCKCYQDSNAIFYRSKKKILKFMFPQAIWLPMISPLPEQADFRRSFTAMYLKMLGIRVEFESPHGMAGSGENWRGILMTGWVIPILGHPASQIWPSHPDSRPWAVGLSPAYLSIYGLFLELVGSPWRFGENNHLQNCQFSLDDWLLLVFIRDSKNKFEPNWL